MIADLVVVHAPVGGGHKSAALATAEAARARGLRVEVLDLFEHAPRIVGDAYLRAHLTGQSALPDLYGPLYFAANRRGGAFEPVRHAIDHAAFGALERAVRDLAPRAVVATHHLPLVVLGDARRRGRLPATRLVGVVTDYTAHACWAEAGVDRFAVATAAARDELAAHGVDRKAIAVTGIPVRPAFEAVAAVRAPRDGEPLRVLVTSGGFGVGPLARVVRSCAGTFGELALVVVCGGASDGRVARIAQLAARDGVDAEVVGFERDMPSRLAAAHVVVGKAGGLTVSEALAAGRPMIVVGAVPGNEKLNEKFVVQGGAGYAARARDVGPLVRAIREAGVLEAMGRRARALVRPRAAESVVDLALEPEPGALAA